MIEIKDLAKIYNTEHGEFKAIENINLTIEDGDIFGIIGMSGAGKSTLLRCINLLERPTLGQILIDGQDVTSLDGKALLQLRRKIGMIFQRFNLLMQRTVEENVSYPLEVCGYPKEKRAERVAELLELVDLSSKAKSYPVQLSGGQQQRVSIARALANNPPILLCDEPTGALDSDTGRKVFTLLQQMSRTYDSAVVVVTHNAAVAPAADRVIRLKDGRIHSVTDNSAPVSMEEVEL